MKPVRLQFDIYDMEGYMEGWCKRYDLTLRDQFNVILNDSPFTIYAISDIVENLECDLPVYWCVENGNDIACFSLDTHKVTQAGNIHKGVFLVRNIDVYDRFMSSPDLSPNIYVCYFNYKPPGSSNKVDDLEYKTNRVYNISSYRSRLYEVKLDTDYENRESYYIAKPFMYSQILMDRVADLPCADRGYAPDESNTVKSMREAVIELGDTYIGRPPKVGTEIYKYLQHLYYFGVDYINHYEDAESYERLFKLLYRYERGVAKLGSKAFLLPFLRDKSDALDRVKSYEAFCYLVDHISWSFNVQTNKYVNLTADRAGTVLTFKYDDLYFALITRYGDENESNTVRVKKLMMNLSMYRVEYESDIDESYYISAVVSLEGGIVKCVNTQTYDLEDCDFIFYAENKDVLKRRILLG